MPQQTTMSPFTEGSRQRHLQALSTESRPKAAYSWATRARGWSDSFPSPRWFVIALLPAASNTSLTMGHNACYVSQP